LNSKVSARVPKRVRGRSSVEDSELLAATIWYLAHGCTYESLSSQFGINKSYLNKTIPSRLRALVSCLANDEFGFISIPSNIPEETSKWDGSLEGDDRFSFLKGCIGAADGTLVPLLLTKNFNQERWRCRHGYTSQNVLAICNFERCFSKVWDGGEGCASDSMLISITRILDWIPDGTFVLFDSGGINHQKMVLPFPGTRYHLKEFTENPPETPEELFNLRHSSRRASRIECTFGLWKARFRVLKVGIVCSDMTTCRLITQATCYLHNFIMRRKFRGRRSESPTQTTTLGQTDRNILSTFEIFQQNATSDGTRPHHHGRVSDKGTVSAAGAALVPLQTLPDVSGVDGGSARTRLTQGKLFQRSLATAAWTQYIGYWSNQMRFEPETAPSSTVQLVEVATNSRRNECDDRFYDT
jgi:hypothetical protein